MSRSDWLLLALNALALALAFTGFTSTHTDPLMWAALVGMVAAVANGTRIIREQQPAPDPVRPRVRDADGRAWWEDIDARDVLDLDERLDALERAEIQRMHALADAGELRAPSAAQALGAEAGPAARRRQRA